MIRGVYYEPKKIKEELPSVYYDNIEIASLPGENWLPVFGSAVPNVKPCYYVSDQGRLYSTLAKGGKGGFKSCNPDKKSGYVKTSFALQDDTVSSMMFHKALMLVFDPIPTLNPQKTQVNHLDGNKAKNELSNLDWCTEKENIQHAYEMNLINSKRGEDHHCATHSENLIRKICEGLEKRLDIEQCAIYAGLEPNRDNRRYISRIKRKELWTHISCEYDIPDESYENKPSFTDNEVHRICWLMQDGLSNMEITDILRPGVDNETRYRYNNTISKIRQGRAYTRITQFYEL